MNYLKWILKELDTPAKKIIVLLTLLLSLGQLQRIQLTPTVAIYLHDLLILGWLGYWLPQNKRLVTQLIQSTWLVIAGFILIGYVSAFLQHNLQPLALLQLGRLIAYLVFGWSLYLSVKKDRLSLDLVRYCGLVVAVLVGWFGWLQYLLLPDTRFLAIAGWDDHYFRLISSQFDPGYTGIILVIGYWLFHSFHTTNNWRYVFSLIFTITIALTYSRASYLAFGWSLVIGGLLISTKPIRQSVAISFICLIVAINFLPSTAGEGTQLTRTSSITARSNHLNDYLTWFKPYNLLVGNGLFIQPQDSATQISNYNDHANLSDNWLITLVSGLGLAGSAWLVYLTLNQMAGRLGQNKIFLTQISAVLVFGLFNNVFQPFVVLLMLLAWIGLSGNFSKGSATPDT